MIIIPVDGHRIAIFCNFSGSFKNKLVSLFYIVLGQDSISILIPTCRFRIGIISNKKMVSHHIKPFSMKRHFFVHAIGQRCSPCPVGIVQVFLESFLSNHHFRRVLQFITDNFSTGDAACIIIGRKYIVSIGSR